MAKNETPEEVVEKMKVRAELYARAFHMASRACSIRKTWTAEELASYFAEKEKLEADLLKKLEGPDAIQFLREEGILWPN